MSTLYPIKFTPIFKEKLWGGQKLRDELGKDLANLNNVGESWEVSGLEGDVSVVANGFLAGNSLEEIIEVYMGDLVGDKVFERFGTQFPLLFKFIDAKQLLSIQVHPNDEVAKERHASFGKTELWYVVQAEEGSTLISGFKEDVTCEEYLQKLEENEVESILAAHEVQAGDVFYIPAGRVHSIGKGILLAEIQQTSDITYRIYDFARKDANGNERELHTDYALDTIDFSKLDNAKVKYLHNGNGVSSLVSCDYFKTQVLELNTNFERDFYELDSFLVFMCVDGAADIVYSGEKAERIQKGETVLIPAELKSIQIQPKGNVTLLEASV